MIEVNGVQYTEKERPQKRMSKTAQSLMMMATAFGSYNFGVGSHHSKPRQRPNVDIVSEYKLIQDKKSKLCKSDRDWVETLFHNNFIEIKQKDDKYHLFP